MVRALSAGRSAFTCGLDAALVVLGGKWKPLILYHLAHGTRRYGELKTRGRERQ
jgi:DNA-binding HxlR family transcriptional regulator